MCGLIGAVGADRGDVEAALRFVAHRGPDGQGVASAGAATFGHTRLAVIDPSEASAQPFQRDGLTVTFNGEIWNFREVRADLEAHGERFVTVGDTEVVAATVARWSVEGLARLEGMFAVAWAADGGAVLARDRFGEVPLHVARRGTETWWASELKALAAVGCDMRSAFDVEPGGLVNVGPDGRATRGRWYSLPAAGPPAASNVPDAARLVGKLLAEGTVERALAADVPVCVLMSGGIDSTASAVHVAEATAGKVDLVGYTAVLDAKSRDLRCARTAAEAVGVRLVEVPVVAPTADDLAAVVAEIEMPYKAQVEIGWACLRLAEAIRGDGFKVTFSGEGSDELWASYGMSYHGIARDGWRAHRAATFLAQARKNFARCNKVFMARSVEVRLPFLHRPLVEMAMDLPMEAVRSAGRPKAVLQEAYRGVLPDEIVDRPKVAFQDGMGLKAACASAVADPKRFYTAEFRRRYG